MTTIMQHHNHNNHNNHHQRNNSISTNSPTLSAAPSPASTAADGLDLLLKAINIVKDDDDDDQEREPCPSDVAHDPKQGHHHLHRSDEDAANTLLSITTPGTSIASPPIKLPCPLSLKVKTNFHTNPPPVSVSSPAINSSTTSHFIGGPAPPLDALLVSILKSVSNWPLTLQELIEHLHAKFPLTRTVPLERLKADVQHCVTHDPKFIKSESSIESYLLQPSLSSQGFQNPSPPPTPTFIKKHPHLRLQTSNSRPPSPSLFPKAPTSVPASIVPLHYPSHPSPSTPHHYVSVMPPQFIVPSSPQSPIFVPSQPLLPAAAPKAKRAVRGQRRGSAPMILLPKKEIENVQGPMSATFITEDGSLKEGTKKRLRPLAPAPSATEVGEVAGGVSKRRGSVVGF
ncbi:hypothetical protein HDV05_006736 [Chytridiales sp. JEL 0842]|nr:hypothetical protein HDV05_006736 [Chytridiales sp. JEL 0842]